MMGLCSKLNEIEEIVELTSVMLNTTASKGINKQFLIDQSADRLLIKLIKESNSKTILVNACDALGYLCSEGTNSLLPRFLSFSRQRSSKGSRV